MNKSLAEAAAECPVVDQDKIDYETCPEIHDVIASIGRTEDVRLSPDNRQLALVDYLDNKLYIFAVDLDISHGSPRIKISNCSVISSRALRHPHGVSFLGNDRVIVCNRSRCVDIFRIPLPDQRVCQHNIGPEKSINGRGALRARVKSPGSVDCYELAHNRYRALVCNNHWHFISSHSIEVGNAIRIRHEGVLLEHSIKIPDGISISVDHAYIAVSNHVHGEVLVYRNTPDLGRETPPSAVLRGIVCPHGVRFSRCGKRVFVADAASQYLYVFQNDDREWKGSLDPSRSIKLLDEDSFYLGREDTREGGLKGIDIDNSGSILVTTRRHNVLGFYQLGRLLERHDPVNSEQIAELCRQRDEDLETRRDRIERRWTGAARARQLLVTTPRKRKQKNKKKALIRKQMWRLQWRNRYSREHILDPLGPVLSMTTYAPRLELVFYSIESISLGYRKPSRVVLWLQDEQAFFNPPETLRRLKARGLEIRLSEDFGPHTKYYPYLESTPGFSMPLVTADDDVLYPRHWLQQLISAYESDPDVIHCHRARRMRLHANRFMPYKAWQHCQSTAPSHLNLVTGVSGAIYPPRFLEHLKQQGRGFEACCPNADDIWITVNALRGGFRIAQIKEKPAHFPLTLGSQQKRLVDANVAAGGNQVQLWRTFSKMDLAALNACQSSEEAS